MIDDQKIIIKKAQEHNLKDIDAEIPKNKLVVFTGISGSGKSSLAFDTLYAEGQRRYVESLSSYARQFLGSMQKPKVESISGLSPAISIDQKTTSHNPRSTVGTITEIYDYLRLLYSRVGRPHCPQCGQEISTQSIDQIINHVTDILENYLATNLIIKFFILSPVVRNKKGEFVDLFQNLRQKGYQRAKIDKDFYELSQDLTILKNNKHSIDVVVDRLSITKKEIKNPNLFKQLRSRIAQSVEESLKLSSGLVKISIIEDESLDFPKNPQKLKETLFSEDKACSKCGISIPEMEPRFFSFNSPLGACKTCNGLGSLLKIDKDKIIAPEITLSQGAIIPFARMMSAQTWWSRLVKTAVEQAGYDFHHTKFKDIGLKTQEMLLFGSDQIYTVKGVNRFGKDTIIQDQFEGFIKNLERRWADTDSDFIRKEIERFMHRQQCPSCNGDRLQIEPLNVFIDKINIAKATKMPIAKTKKWIESLQEGAFLNSKEKIISTSILKEIKSRLDFLSSVGLDYLTLSREAATLAGGEAQRIRLASQIGTGLTGILYILDEPTIGLHPRDNDRLIATLRKLQQRGNSVIVVEHDRDVMLASDYIFDFGPQAGKNGGRIIAQGTPDQIIKDKKSVTGQYLSRKKDVCRTKKLPKSQRLVADDEIFTQEKIYIWQASQHNLKNIDISFPLRKLTCITGMSGSGKSTLMHDTLYQHVAKHLGKNTELKIGKIEKIMIPEMIKRVTMIDQSPIGKTPRSNPATYTKIFDHIRLLFANTKDAHLRGYKPGRFSFNVKGGRCETCQGDGQIKIEMQFLPDIYVTCDVCNGNRYNQETLEIKYKGKNISQVLSMSVEEALSFFANNRLIHQKLQTLQDVGLNYIQLGQPAPTLSGGEAQRVKLAKELSSNNREHVLYLLDEPTTGLHFQDINKLLKVLHQLVDQDNTVIIIEHNLDIIKNADWIIDLGPEGGDRGGEVIAEGSVEDVSKSKSSFTAQYLKEELLQSKMS